MIKPTNGRVLWYKPSADEAIEHDGTQLLASLLCYVVSDSLVNLTVHDMNGYTHPKSSVPLFQGNAEECPEGSACWMPYQQQQARAAESAGNANAESA